MDTVERKITKIGHSYGVVIPNDLLKIAGLKQGDEVLLDYVDDEFIIRKSRKVELPEGISGIFLKDVQEAMTEYDDTLKDLVDRWSTFTNKKLSQLTI